MKVTEKYSISIEDENENTEVIKLSTLDNDVTKIVVQFGNTVTVVEITALEQAIKLINEFNIRNK